MSNGRLKLLTAPAEEPVTLTEALEHCHANSGIEDAWFNRAIVAAREEAEDTLRRSLITQTWQLWFDNWPSLPIELPRSPVISLSSVKTYDIDDTETTIASANFTLDNVASPARLMTIDSYSWPSTNLRAINSFVVEYVAGYGGASSVPSRFKQAILLHIGYYYENRASEIQRPPQAFFNLLEGRRLHL